MQRITIRLSLCFAFAGGDLVVKEGEKLGAIRWKWKLTFLVVVFAVLVGCSADKDGGGSGSDRRVESVIDRTGRSAGVLRPDQNGEIRLVAKETKLKIAPGVEKEVWTYNGGVPGPEIRVKQGETVRVRFKNELPVPTTIHCTGIRYPTRWTACPD